MLSRPSLSAPARPFGLRASVLAPAEQSASRLRAAELDAAWQNLFCASDDDFASAKDRFARANN